MARTFYGTVPGSAASKVKDANAASDNAQYAVIEPGYYPAVVLKATEGRFNSTMKGQTGKFNYLKVTPDFQLLNENETRINRQDFTLGVVNDSGLLYRPDGDDSKPALYSDAAFLIGAMGFKDEDSNVDLGQFSPKLVMGQVVTVKIVTDTYEARDGSGPKTKNKIASVYPLSDTKAEDLELVGNGAGMWFRTDEDLENFLDAREALLADEDYDEDENV